VKVRFILDKLDDVRYNHLKANLEFFKWELVLSAQKLIELAERSRLLKVLKLSKNVRTLIQIMRDYGEMIVEQVKEFVDYRVWSDGDKTFFEIYINDAYFEMKKALSSNPLARKIGGKIYSVEDFVRAVGKEVEKEYCKEYQVKLIEEDES